MKRETGILLITSCDRLPEAVKLMTYASACIKAALVAGVTLTGASIALAQESSKRVATFTDWSVFNPTSPVECYIASAPTSSVAKRGGQTLPKVNRSAITFYISTRPADNVVNEVSFSAGYPFKPKSTVNMKIGSETFELYVEGEVAWPDSPEEDRKVIAAMKKGSTAVITGVSRRGTTTIDTFSLLGFTDALSDAAKRCNVSG